MCYWRAMVPSVWSKMNVQDTQFTAHFDKQSKMVSFLMQQFFFISLEPTLELLETKKRVNSKKYYVLLSNITGRYKRLLPV